MYFLAIHGQMPATKFFPHKVIFTANAIRITQHEHKITATYVIHWIVEDTYGARLVEEPLNDFESVVVSCSIDVIAHWIITVVLQKFHQKLGFSNRVELARCCQHLQMCLAKKNSKDTEWEAKEDYCIFAFVVIVCSPFAHWPGTLQQHNQNGVHFSLEPKQPPSPSPNNSRSEFPLDGKTKHPSKPHKALSFSGDAPLLRERCRHTQTNNTLSPHSLLPKLFFERLIASTITWTHRSHQMASILKKSCKRKEK